MYLTVRHQGAHSVWRKMLACVLAQDATYKILNDIMCLGQVARAGDLADWLVRKSTLHPAFRGVAFSYSMRMGGRRDPTVKGLEPLFEPLALQLQKAAYARALRLVR